MKTNSTDTFENAPVPKAVMSNVIPSMVSIIMVLVYNLADTFFIGQTKNDLMVAAISIAAPAFIIFMAVGMMFGIGGTSNISRKLGQNNTVEAKYASAFCCWTGVAVGIIATILIVCFTNQIGYLVGASDDTILYVEQYLKIVAFSIPFLIFSNIFSSIIRAEGHANIAMTGMIIGNAINIILDPILILVLGFNVAGAAAATVIGNVCSTIFYLTHLLSKRTMLSIHPKNYRIGNGIATGVLAIGFPASLNNILISVSAILLNNLMVHYGDMAVAGLGVASKINMIIVSILVGFGTGIQPLLGYCYGAKNKERFMDILKFSLLFSFTLSVIVTILCYAGAGGLTRLFLDNDDAFGYGVLFARIYILSGPVMGMLLVLINIIQATGASIPALILSISRQGIVYIPALYALYFIFDQANIIAYAQPIADYLSFGLAIVLFRITYRKYLLPLVNR